MDHSLQDTYAPQNRCFGCGPANDQGLRIKSFPVLSGSAGGSPDDVGGRDGTAGAATEVVCTFTTQPHHQAFPGMVNGGICGALLDCHSNWTAAYHLMRRAGAESPPCTVTADFHVKLRRPTPLGVELTIRAHVTESEDDRAVVEATIEAGGEVTAKCRGTFVAVKPGHPAYHRW